METQLDFSNISSFHDLVNALDVSKWKSEDHETEAKALEFANDVGTLKKRMVASRRGLINPRSKRVQYWDLLTTTALLFTATVTPYEVCLGLPTKVNALWVVNLIVNSIFMIDIVVQFVMPINDHKTGELIRSHKVLARKYCLTWFWIDLGTVLPFDILTLTVRCRVASHRRAPASRRCAPARTSIQQPPLTLSCVSRASLVRHRCPR